MLTLPFPRSHSVIPALCPPFPPVPTSFPRSYSVIPVKAGIHKPTTSSSRKRGQARRAKPSANINNVIPVKTGTADPPSPFIGLQG